MMAEFSKVMRQWRRMCAYNTKKYGNCIDADCPLMCNSLCGELKEATNQEIESAEKAIMQWAAEHPEPVYPTWGELFMNTDVLMHHWDKDKIIYSLNTTHIPADIAQKLGIEPKEG